MKFDKNLAAIHGYLCADGYIIKNPSSQKHRYYYIGFRNTNNVLLKDFQHRFESVFGLKPTITKEGRCRIQNKEIYNQFTQDYSYYSYEWKLSKLSKDNLRHWLRAFFDCEGWVENQPDRYSRLIRVDSCNEKGILDIQKALQKFNISSSVKKRINRTMWRLTICGIGNLIRFQKDIGFLHPQKRAKLSSAIDSFRSYVWNIPQNKEELSNFITEKGRIRKSTDEVRFFSIIKKNLLDFKKVLNKYNIYSKIFGPWKNNSGSLYYCIIIKLEGGNELWWNSLQ